MGDTALVQHARGVLGLVNGLGAAPRTAIEEPIKNSWQRCVNDYRLDPARSHPTCVVDTRNLKELQGQHEELVDIARAEMDTLYDQISGSGYALLLTDVHMPDIDGYTLAHTIRMEEGGGRHMPILALSANALRGEGRRAREAGIDDYLVKPVQIARLGEALAQWMPAARRATSPPPAPAASASVGVGGSVDLSVLQRLVGTDPAVISDLLRDFRATLQAQIAAIQADLERHDLRKVQSNAHRLKSSSRSVGALPLGDLCAGVENACALGNHDAVATLVPELVRTAAAVAVELV